MYSEVKMKIDQNYLELLLKPLEDSADTKSQGVLWWACIKWGSNRRSWWSNRSEIWNALYIFKYEKIISNIDGRSDLKDLGITIGGGGHIAITGHKLIMKAEVQDSVMSQINIGSINSNHLQVGNNNTQIMNMNVQELVEKVAQSNDPEAKSKLMSLLQNNTVASVLGASVSGLLGLL